MNTFRFVGNLIKPKQENFIKELSNGNKVMKLIIKQNDTNSAYVQLTSDKINNGKISVVFKNKGRQTVNYEDRFNEDIVKEVSYVSKTITNIGTPNGENIEFIFKEDFIRYINKHISEYPANTIFEVKGEFVITEYKGKFYNNFNIKSIMIANQERPELTLKLELFYNNKSFDESDKRNKFILNAYIEQYMYAQKSNAYIPIQVQFNTNRFDFKNATHIEVIKHRKANMFPPIESGYVKALWEAQYVRGAQLIMPPLETLPKDIQFEVINAGRDIKEYMSNIVSEAKEIICLTRPDNTISKEGAVYTSLNCTENEFKSKIYKVENISNIVNTIDNIANKEAEETPFN